MTVSIEIPKARKKQYLPADFQITDWEGLQSYWQELKERPIESTSNLEQWLLDWSELESFINEEFALRYIAITTNTQDEAAQAQYQFAVQELIPKIAPFEDELNRKLVNSPFVAGLNSSAYTIALRSVKNEVEIFRKENIPLATEIQLEQRKYGQLFSQMMVEHDGKELTLQQASVLLENPDRQLRESIYRKIQERMLQDREALEELFDKLLELRHKMAVNADFDNYRDFKFKALGRFDYTPKDCAVFHDAVQQAIVPFVNQLYKIRKEKLGYEQLRPWDLKVDWSGQKPLRPFESVPDLIEKTTEALNQIDPEFGNSLRVMQKMNRLDLDSRSGKSPGGYNMPLHFSGVPFIFMNASESLKDVFTLIHESGHAVHSLSMRNYPLTQSKQPPPEIAELASMTMELLSMDYCEVFFENKKELHRAKMYQLTDVLLTLPWVATVDKFQHWIYTHPHQSGEERKAAWLQIHRQFDAEVIDRSDLKHYLEYVWHRQLHIFEVPFYYIEYGMAQLGAIAIWKRFREDPATAIADFKHALQLGYTRPIGEIYEAAGVRFDFSKDYVEELVSFVWDELSKMM